MYLSYRIRKGFQVGRMKMASMTPLDFATKFWELRQCHLHHFGVAAKARKWSLKLRMDRWIDFGLFGMSLSKVYIETKKSIWTRTDMTFCRSHLTPESSSEQVCSTNRAAIIFIDMSLFKFIFIQAHRLFSSGGFDFQAQQDIGHCKHRSPHLHWWLWQAFCHLKRGLKVHDRAKYVQQHHIQCCMDEKKTFKETSSNT